MADTEMKPFEDVKEEIVKRVPEGYVLDDDKIGDLKAAYEAANGDLSKIDISAFTKKQEEQNANAGNDGSQASQEAGNTPDPSQPTVISETQTAQEAPTDENWKAGVLKEWQEWSDQKDKVLEQYEDKDHKENLTFRILNKEGQLEADFSYAGPKNVTMKGKDGNVPAAEYFDKLVAQIKAANGPKIEFGDIKSDEFKAKLLAACLKDPEIQIVNPPSQEQIATWDKSLQEMIAQAKPKSNESQESQAPQYEAAKNILTETLKNGQEIDLTALQPEKQALYVAAAMELAAEKIKSGEITLKGAPKYDELAKAAEKLSDKEKEAAKKGLTSYTIMSLRQTSINRGFNTDKNTKNDWKTIDANTAELSDEQKKLRALRGQARSGDEAAKTELNKRREQTMSDEYKYVRETEMEADGTTPKKDEKGKPVYKKDENGNFVYKTDDKGNKVESAAYQAFKAKLNSGNANG